MKNYLYVVNKQEIKKKNDVIYLINTIKDCEHTFNTHIENNIECYSYTNENIDLPEKNKEYFFAFSGQLADSNSYIKKGIQSANRGYEKNFISNLAGANSISYLHIPSKTVEAYNSFSGVNPVYYCENEERIVVGIDPLVVNCVAYDSRKPIFDLSNISSFLMMGYFFSHDTLFKNVKSIPHNSMITLKNNSLSINAINNAVENMFSIEPSQQIYDDLADSYLKSLDVIPSSAKNLSVGLTGGKDSRLIVLGMKEKNFDFKTITRGHENHPDVKVAKLLAEKMELNHSVKQSDGKKKNELEIDLKEKILKTMLGTNGLLYGYENLGYSTNYRGEIGITGVGAEAIRGGFGITRDKEVDDISKFLLSNYYPYKDLIKPGYRKNYQNELKTIGDKATSLRETGNKLFIEFYNGKRTGAARAGLSYYSNSLSPFFDNNFLKQATKINIEEIASEKVHYNLMRTLNSDVAMIPFANARWSFEKHGPLDPNDFNGWMNRQPIIAKTKRGGYNWRQFRNKDKTFIEEFKSLLLDNPHSEVYQIVDYNKIKSIFDGTVSGSLNRFLWSLLSIKLYIDYFDKGNHTPSKIFLKLPEDEEVNVKQSKIHDLLNYINPLNDKLIINGNKYPVIRVNQESEKFGYLVVGDGNLTTPSSVNSSEIFIIDKTRKSLSVRFCINVLNNNFEISLYIMFFDNEANRIYSQEFNQAIVLGINYLSKTINIDQRAKSVKYAIKVKSKEEEFLFNIKYAYMKYNQ